MNAPNPTKMAPNRSHMMRGAWNGLFGNTNSVDFLPPLVHLVDVRGLLRADLRAGKRESAVDRATSTNGLATGLANAD